MKGKKKKILIGVVFVLVVIILAAGDNGDLATGYVDGDEFIEKDIFETGEEFRVSALSSGTIDTNMVYLTIYDNTSNGQTVYDTMSTRTNPEWEGVFMAFSIDQPGEYELQMDIDGDLMSTEVIIE